MGAVGRDLVCSSTNISLFHHTGSLAHLSRFLVPPPLPLSLLRSAPLLIHLALSSLSQGERGQHSHGKVATALSTAEIHRIGILPAQ